MISDGNRPLDIPVPANVAGGADRVQRGVGLALSRWSEESREADAQRAHRTTGRIH
ncbi:hypothetical protein [Amycolatopsis sp. cmx-4-61]|uniref:hypothetical protein n=1 Tax=Amycolatopsis sp. cmx-4-61 TaxID=2790937 RepID=UPI00397E3B09